ncbi:MAG: hypothetical protein IJS08_09035 [Victivallales bacterium]|nr:hypothetical protein [Victivallales bacterium]
MKLDIAKDGIMQTLARLKGIPVSKVIRNAGRDFAQAALKATPITGTSKSEYARTKRKGKAGWQYIRLDKCSPRQRRLLAKKQYKIVIHRGLAKASWKGVFQALAMTTGSPNVKKNMPSKVATMSGAISRGTEQMPEIVISNILDFYSPRRRGTDADILAAGFKLASERIVKEINRMLQAAAK